MLRSSVPMKVPRTVRVAVALCVCMLGLSPLASAEIVYMTSGGTLSVKGHQNEGDTVTLMLRSGGQVSCDKTLIDKIVPDEVPHPDPIPPSALQLSMPAQAQPASDRTAELRDTAYASLISAAAE